jgi:hypothetical protein
MRVVVAWARNIIGLLFNSFVVSKFPVRRMFGDFAVALRGLVLTWSRHLVTDVGVSPLFRE